MASLPGAVAVDRPLKLGSTFLGQGADDEGYYTLKLDFQPESLQQAQHADLLLLGADQLKLIPLLPDGDGFHFEGTLEQLHQRPGSDLQCVAYFDGNEWTLQVVHAQLHTKHRPGVPLVPGYNIDLPGEEADPAAAANVSAVQQQLQSSSLQQDGHEQAAEHEIDPDLDDALEEALFASDRSSSQPRQPPPPQQHRSEQPAPHPAGLGLHTGQQPQQAHPQPVRQQHQGAQPQQPPQQPQQQQPAPVAPPPVTAAAAAAAAQEEDDEDSADDDSDDPWNQFDAGAAPAPAPVPSAPKPAEVQPLPVHVAQRHMSALSVGNGAGAAQRSTTLQPAPAPRQQQQAPVAAPVQPAAAAAPPAAAAAGASGVSRGAVSVLGGDEEEEEDAGHDAQDCSEDESDGVGVEYL